ncbi:prophage P1 protein 32 [Lactiplantibacillus plantarum]|uniref:Uncharacterized protein n=1 Tax=Lactiplantibacillus plantarum TaxID=1590 RepID=A0A1E3KRU6_LACPN|nr:hypothetical protein S102022_01781 [Lactiplantibacillus plantarum]MCG0627361.1 prophage P1 protein 32 [Lactiplantibacillus plantarum]MCG0666708.1 prophage P1 protein 32 [Lactiplantibacillus plantarum]MCG0693455.1 prophage P1 protein 32 [Lactiplantibacillus plantarum]ODO61337.1 hypothetical protein LPJSA22_01312 [Lactiplantibacillus plantarum]
MIKFRGIPLEDVGDIMELSDHESKQKAAY